MKRSDWLKNNVKGIDIPVKIPAPRPGRPRQVEPVNETARDFDFENTGWGEYNLSTGLDRAAAQVRRRNQESERRAAMQAELTRNHSWL